MASERGTAPAKKNVGQRVRVSRHSPLCRRLARQRATRRPPRGVRCACDRVLEAGVQVRATQVARHAGRSGRFDSGVLSAGVREGLFASFDPARARFRTYLRTCLDRFVANVRQQSRRLKRGGSVELVPFDFAAAERELQRQHSGAVQELDAFFHREWLRSLFALAVDRLRVQCAASGRAVRFTIFNRYDLADEESVRPTYAALAGELKVSVADVTNDLAAARRDFRRLGMTVLREQCATDDEFENEARALGPSRDL